MYELFIGSFVTFFVVIDPLGIAPIFAVMTEGASSRFKRRMILKAVFAGTVILLMFAFVGNGLLKALGISLMAFKTAGGVLLFMIALDMIKDLSERSQIKKTILQSKKEIIELSESQIEQFAGNALELESEQGKLLAISQTAVDALTPKQKAAIEKSAKIVALKVKTIELAGGSVRCMLAGIHLERAKTQ